MPGTEQQNWSREELERELDNLRTDVVVHKRQRDRLQQQVQTLECRLDVVPELRAEVESLRADCANLRRDRKESLERVGELDLLLRRHATRALARVEATLKEPARSKVVGTAQLGAHLETLSAEERAQFLQEALEGFCLVVLGCGHDDTRDCTCREDDSDNNVSPPVTPTRLNAPSDVFNDHDL